MNGPQSLSHASPRTKFREADEVDQSNAAKPYAWAVAIDPHPMITAVLAMRAIRHASGGVRQNFIMRLTVDTVGT